MALEISGTMSKHQLKLADRQCRMAELSRPLPGPDHDAGTSLYGARHEDPLVRDAADVLCQNPPPKTPRPPPVKPLLPPGDTLGADIATGGFPGIAGFVPDEILMRYEQ